MGASDEDVVQVAYGYGLFTGGLGMHYGAETLGAAVIPISGSNTQRQLMLMEDFGTTVVCCTPSFAIYLWDVAQQVGMDVTKLPLKVGVFGAEPWSEAMRKDIEAKWNIKACDIYGLSEIVGPGVSCECVEAQSGLHINEDHFLPEIIDPDTGEVLPYGEQGELVFTTLTKEAFPLIRYRTGDITSLNPEPCICGRTNVRMARVSGRTDDMLIIRGVNVFPSQVESVLLMSPQVEPHYRLIVTRKGAMDNMEVQVEIKPSLYREVSDAMLSLDDVTTFTEHDVLVGSQGRYPEEHQRHHRHQYQGDLQGAWLDRAQRGQGPARGRPAQGAVELGGGRHDGATIRQGRSPERAAQHQGHLPVGPRRPPPRRPRPRDAADTLAGLQAGLRRPGLHDARRAASRSSAA